MNKEKINYKSVSYNSSYKDEIVKLMKSKPFKKYIWDWQFIENPDISSYEPVIFVDKWSTAIGFNGLMPVKIKYGNNIINGAWSCDFYVDEKYRGKGLGKEIKNELHQKYPLIMALGISDDATRVLRRMGWQEDQSVYNYRKIQNVNNVKNALLKVLEYLTEISKGGEYHNNIYKVVKSDSLPERNQVETLWENVNSHYEKVIVRDYDYLHWKYENHPIARYDYLSLWAADSLAALLVIRTAKDITRIVDYIGPCRNLEIKEIFLKEVINEASASNFIACITNDPEWEYVLLKYGFHRQAQQRFFIYSDDSIRGGPVEGWFVMGGDSDGDLLNAAEYGPFKKNTLVTENSDKNLVIKRLSEYEFDALEREWTQLVDRSDADPFFLGWKWQHSWWRQWSAKRGMELILLAIISGNKLIALAPLYRITKKTGLYKYRKIQFIGCSWGDEKTVRTEYTDFIVDQAYSYRAKELIFKHLSEKIGYEQLILADIDKQSHTCYLVTHGEYFRKCYIRKVHFDTCTFLNTDYNFSDFLSILGRNTRYKSFNQREKLGKIGNIEIKKADEQSIDEYFDLINRFHRERWSKNCFDGDSLQFHKKLARLFLQDNKLEFSKMTLNSKAVSVLYNIKSKDTVYNIQSGFINEYSNKFSIGKLHLGYSIESAFNDDTVKIFDLLAGPGKNVYYKSHYGSQKRELVTIQINKSFGLKVTYRTYDILPKYVKRLFNKYLFKR